jgi:hypothetical protein
MAQPTTLNGTYIDETYQRLVQVEGGIFTDGTGSLISLVPGSVNPTPNYLPFNNAGVFADSYLYQSGSVLKTIIGGEDIGIYLDYTNNSFKLGDPAALEINHSVQVNGSGPYPGITLSNNDFQSVWYVGDNIIKTIIDGGDIGLKLDFSANSYTLGDPAGNNITVSDNGGGDNATLSLLNGVVTFTAIKVPSNLQDKPCD